jgi:hypothetical protein
LGGRDVGAAYQHLQHEDQGIARAPQPQRTKVGLCDLCVVCEFCLLNQSV